MRSTMTQTASMAARMKSRLASARLIGNCKIAATRAIRVSAPMAAIADVAKVKTLQIPRIARASSAALR